MKKQPKNKNKKKKGKALKVILILLLIILILVGGFVGYSTIKNGWGMKNMLATIVGHDKETLKDLEEFQVLLMGVSTDITSTLTDTIIIATYNPQQQKAALISIPRDTFVGKSEKSATSVDKINSLYQKGPEETVKAVNEITGLDIKNYVVIRTEALIELVNTIGGVEFDVPINMHYTDTSQDLYIRLKKGPQKLNGDQAEQLVRFRKNDDGTTYPASYGNGDTGRMRTQREFLTAVLKQAVQAKNILKIGEFVDIAYRNVETNVSLSEAKDYLPYILEFNTENLYTNTIIGENKQFGPNNLWFFECDKTETQQLISEMFEDAIEEEPEENTNNENTVSDSSNGGTSVNVSKTEAKEIKIELLNASGSTKKLNEVSKILKDKGYKIVKTSPTTSAANTIIIKKSEKDEKFAEHLKELISGATVFDNTVSSSEVDFTIIIGKDYK